MRARVEIYSNDGQTYRGILPVIDLKFSEDIGGGGSCQYEALKSDIDALSAWDAVVKIRLERAAGVWINGPAYVSRHEYSHPGGFRRYQFNCRGLLEAWASETIVLPEYVVNTMPARAGAERGIGWMSSSYYPGGDPYEPWDRCYQTGRTSRPPDWPSGTGAEWISATGATKETESKYFRTWMTITGSGARLVGFWFASDESGSLWVAGERVIQTSSTETGYKEKPATAKMRLYPGTYAVGIHTTTDFTKGGDGVDPVIAAAAILDAEGDPATWIMHTSDEAFIACRRDDVPPNDIPPGPNPGQVVRYLINEAKERKATGWPNTGFGFSTTEDSYGQPWGNHDIVEQIHAYGTTTYWNLFEMWAESREVDVWMGADLVLHAALPRQGRLRSITFTETHFASFYTQGTEGNGNWVIAQGHGGWIYAGSKTPRREFAMTLGTAYSRPIAKKIATAALKDAWLWEGGGRMNPPQPGWIPYYDFQLGDWMHVSYRQIEHDVSITSMGATAGEGGLLWDIEFTEYPDEAEVPPSGGEIEENIALQATSTTTTTQQPVQGLFEDLESYVPAPTPSPVRQGPRAVRASNRSRRYQSE